MTKKEFSQLSIGLKAAYPRFQMLATDEEMTFWYTMLQDIDYKVAQNAALEHISTNIFPPSIAEIRKLCAERMKRPVLSFDEAWGVVVKARSQCGRDEPLKAYERMDELTLSVVKNLGWYQICTTMNDEATRANFREAYEAKVKKIQSDMQIPEFVAQNKLQIQEHYIPAIETKAVPQIEDARPVDIRETLTDEQLARRSQMFEETRRRLLGGETE